MPENEDAQKRALELVTKASKEFDSMTTVLRQKWLRFYKLYRLFKNEAGMPWNSKLFIAKIFEVVEKISPRMTAHNPEFSLIPKKESAQGATEKLAQYLKFTWEERDLKDQMKMLAKSMLIYGTAIAKIEWSMETSTEEDEGMLEEVIQSELPTFKVLDIFDFLIDPREENIDDGIGVIHRRDNVHFQELLRNKEAMNYMNLDRIKLMMSAISAKNKETSEQETKFSSRGISEGSDLDDTRLNIKEFWGRFSETGDVEDEKEYIITTVNDSILIRLEENPYGFRPFVAAHDMRVPNEFYGVGEVEPLESLQVELNWLRSQRMDNVNLINNKMWLVDNDSGVNPSDLRSVPGNVIFKNPQSVVQSLEVSDVKSSSYREEEQLNRDVQTISGTIDTTDRGGAQGFTNTATGERIRNAEANIRFQAKIENLENAIREIGKKMLILTSKFADQDVLIRKLTENGQVEFEVIPQDVFEEIATGISVRVETGSVSADTAFDRRNDAIAKWNIDLQSVQAGVPVDLVKSYKDVMRTFGVTNPEEKLQTVQGGEAGLVPGAPEGGQVAQQTESLPPELAALEEEEINL